MFFKNIVFVTPIFLAGYFSFYSSTVIYDDYLYQCYNLFFTSWPILIFAIFDFQYEKEEFQRNPKHYKIGFNNELFGKKVFAKWFLTGIIYGAIIFFVSFMSTQTADSTGRVTASMTISGQIVFCCVVAFVNMKIFLSSHNILGFTWFFCYCSTLCFVLFFYLFNKILGRSIYEQFHLVYKSGKTYLILGLICCGLAGLDEGFQMIKRMRQHFKDQV